MYAHSVYSQVYSPQKTRLNKIINILPGGAM